MESYCKIKKAQPINPEMGNLPLERLKILPRPFSYFGPMEKRLVNDLIVCLWAGCTNADQIDRGNHGNH